MDLAKHMPIRLPEQLYDLHFANCITTSIGHPTYFSAPRIPNRKLRIRRKLVPHSSIQTHARLPAMINADIECGRLPG